jgi:hypothetical protein
MPERMLPRKVSRPPISAAATRTMMMIAFSTCFACSGVLAYEVSRINPSCAALATSRPSRANTLPRVKPRAPEALGLSMA